MYTVYIYIKLIRITYCLLIVVFCYFLVFSLHLIIRLVLSLSLSSGVTWRFHEKEILCASVSSFVSVVISAYIHCLITLAEFEGARITLRLYTYLLG